METPRRPHALEPKSQTLNQPELATLHAERNLIEDFAGAERCPKLKEVNLHGNPIAYLETYRSGLNPRPHTLG